MGDAGGDQIEQIGRHQLRMLQRRAVISRRAPLLDFFQIGIAAHAQIHAHRPPRRQTLAAVPGIFQRGVGQLQHQALLGIHDAGFVCGNTEELGGKCVDIRQGRHAVCRLLRKAAPGRNRSHQVASGVQAVPESSQILPTRKAPGQANDGDFLCFGCCGRSEVFRLCLHLQTRPCLQISQDVGYRPAFDQQGKAQRAAQQILQPRQHVHSLHRAAAQPGKRRIQRDFCRCAEQHLGPDLTDLLGQPGQLGQLASCNLCSLCNPCRHHLARWQQYLRIQSPRQPVLRQLLALQLAAGSARQTRQQQHSRHRIGQIILGKLTNLRRPILQFTLRYAVTRPDQTQGHLLAPAVRRRGRAKRHLTGLQPLLGAALQQPALDIGGHQIAAIEKNHILQTPGNGQPAIKQKAQIAGFQPAIRSKQIRIALSVARIPKIARRHIGATNLHFAQPRIVQRPALLIGHAQLH